MNRRTALHSFLALLMLVFIGSAFAGTPRILVLGDSWAAGIFGFKAFDTVLAKHGVTDVAVVGATTALGGSRADQWAENHKGKLDALRAALDENPTIDIIHVSIGGNDFLRSAMEDGVVGMPEAERKVIWARIWKDIETLLQAIHDERPDAHILLNDYDYLDPALMTKTFGMKFPEGVTAETLNSALLELAQFKQAKAKEAGLCDYIQHFGLLQYHYGNPQHVEKHAGPLPGMPPGCTPFAGGKPEVANSPEAMPDGVHPMPEGYVYVIDRCYESFYKTWLAEVPVEAAASK